MPRDRRAFARHPTRLPVRVRATTSRVIVDETALAQDVSQGGIRLVAPRPFAQGERVTLTILVADREWEFTAVVMWARPAEGGFELGLSFEGAVDAARARLVAQICHIEAYRLEAVEGGRTLSSEVAAHEWSARHAHEFPEF